MKKAFWYFLQILAVLLLFGSLPIGILLPHPAAGWTLFIAIILLHLGELWVTVPLAKKRKLPVGIALLKTMLFGFTWWVPFKQGLLQR